MASVTHCSPLENSWEVIPDDAPRTVVPFQNRSRERSRSPFSYLSQVLPEVFKRKDAEPPEQTEQHSGEETDKVELEAVATAVSWEGLINISATRKQAIKAIKAIC